MNPHLSIPKVELTELCQAHGIRRFATFSSALRSDLSPESDVAALAEFVPGRTPGLSGLAGMEMELSTLFDSRMVDLRTPEDLGRYFHHEVVSSAEVQYARGW
ncbi:MAG: nucleotidyltransferase [Alphaproteobacteria bacterium]|nr:nucleotidyltransferase [Alphaproteobacteria bacterium]